MKLTKYLILYQFYLLIIINSTTKLFRHRIKPLPFYFLLTIVLLNFLNRKNILIFNIFYLLMSSSSIIKIHFLFIIVNSCLKTAYKLSSLCLINY